MRARAHIIDTSGIFIFALLVYALTCCRSVYVGDAGELTLALSTGGIAHPPGYPLYTVLGWVWLKLLFFLKPALAANLFSAVTAAAAAALLHRLLLHLLPQASRPAAAAAALVFAFSHPVWSSATAAEVYALSAFLYIAALLVVISLVQMPSRRHLYMAAFACGLTLTHHFSGGVVVLGLALAVMHRGRVNGAMTFKTLSVATGFFLLPLTLYGYLLLRFDPALPINWLAERSPQALWALISGTIYQHYVSVPVVEDMLAFFGRVALDMLHFAGPGILALAVIGVVSALARRSLVAVVILLPAVINLIMVSMYHIPDFAGYLMPVLVAAAIFLYEALVWLKERLHYSPAIALTIAAVIAAAPLAYNYGACDVSCFRLAERYGQNLLASAPAEATVILKSDNGAHSALYQRYAEGFREDVEVFGTNGTLTRLKHRYGGESFAAIVAGLEAEGGRLWWGTEYIINQGMNPSAREKTTRGMLYGPAKAGLTAGGDGTELAERIARFTRDSLGLCDLHGELKAQQISLEYRLHRLEWVLSLNHREDISQAADALFEWARRVDEPMTLLAVAQFYRVRDLTDESLRWIEQARAAAPSSYEMKEVYIVLGAVMRQRGELAAAYDALRRAVDLAPNDRTARYNAHLVKSEMSMRQQDWPAAAAQFDSLILLEPENPMLYYNEGVICERIPGRRDRALECYRYIIDLAGNEGLVMRARERIAALDSVMAGAD